MEDELWEDFGVFQNIKELLDKAEDDKYAQYSTEWQAQAVAVLNEYNFDHDYYDNEIFDLDSDEWDELVRHQLESRGTAGLLFFLGKLEPMDKWAQLDGYGNAVAVSGSDLVGRLKDVKKEVGYIECAKSPIAEIYSESEA